MRTIYASDLTGRIYGSAEECLAAEGAEMERRAYWSNNHDPAAKLDKLKSQLDAAMHIAPDTIATCTCDSLRVKAMVTVCQAFAEDNKQYLQYY